MLKMRIDSVRIIVVHCFLLMAAETDVQIPPSITIGPEPYGIYLTGSPINRKCKAEGIPDVRYTWIKDGVEIKEFTNTYNPNIYITSATSDDEGFYQCAASNPYGRDLSDKSHVQIVDLQELMKPRHSLVEKITVSEGMPFSISAPVTQRFSMQTFQQWHYSSYSAGKCDTKYQILQPSKRIQMAANGDLYFAYAIPDDELVCYQPSYHSFLPIDGNYTTITVLRVDNNSIQAAPRLRNYDFPNVALFGKSVSFRCIFSGFPEPTISWTWPSNSRPTPGRHQLNLNETQLFIAYVEASDEGKYSCFASNSKGHHKEDFHVRVEAVPSFHRKSDRPHNIDAIEGSTVTFVCNPDAKPEALIDWFQNGEIINVNKIPRRFEISDNRRSLTIKYVSRKCTDRESKTDLMVIQCNASNVHGYVFASGYLNVVAAPACKGAMLVDWWIVLVSSVSTGVLLFLFGLCIGCRCKQFSKHRVVERRNQVEDRTRNNPDSVYDFVRGEPIKLKPVGTSKNRPKLQTRFDEPQSARPLVRLPPEAERPGPECDYYTQMSDRSPSVDGSDGYAPIKQPHYLMLSD